MHRELEALGGWAESVPTNVWEWIKKSFTVSYRGEIEAYLADSCDHIDLENRIRLLQLRGVL